MHGVIVLVALSAQLAGAPAEQAATPESTSILVLATGQKVEVASYRVEGSMVHIEGLKGEALIMRTKQIDLEASMELTARREAKRQAEADAEQARLAAEAEAELRAEQQRRLRSSARTTGVRRTGGFSVLSGSDVKTPAPPPTVRRSRNDDKADASASAASKDQAAKRAKREEAQKKIKELDAKLLVLAERIANANMRIRQFGDLSTHGGLVKKEKAQYEAEVVEARNQQAEARKVLAEN